MTLAAATTTTGNGLTTQNHNHHHHAQATKHFLDEYQEQDPEPDDLPVENGNGKSPSSPAPAPRSGSVALMKLKTYLLALRPWSLSASLVPTLLGSALAYRSAGVYDFNLLTFLLTIFTVITVHCAGNVTNTYFDFVKGIDSRKSSDDRTLVDHILTKDQVPSSSFYMFALLNIMQIRHTTVF